MADSLFLRFCNAMNWAHKQRSAIHIKEGDVKITLYCNGNDVPGFEIVRIMTEELERLHPNHRRACIVCKCDPCICDIPF